MATSSSDLITPKELMYGQKKMSYPSYRLVKILPINGSQVNLQLSNSQSEVIFEIPQNCHNMSQSVLQWTRRIAPQTGLYSWIPQDCIPEIYEIQFMNRSKTKLVDITDFNKFTKVTNYVYTPVDELLCRDQRSGLYTSNNVPNYGARLDGTSSVSLLEPTYAACSAIATEFDQVMQIKLGDIKETYFAQSKDMLFGEVMYLRILFTSQYIGWAGTSNLNPAIGTTALVAANIPYVNTSCVAAATDLSLYLAVEQNQEIISSLTAKVAAGMSVTIPYVWCIKTVLAKSLSSQTVSLRFSSAHGRTCKRILHAVFNAEQLNLGYDHSNINNTATANVGGKITSYYTMVNNLRTMEINPNCYIPTPFGPSYDDYMLHRPVLKDSLLFNANIYEYNHVHVECFDQQRSGGEIASDQNYDNEQVGIPLDKELKFDWFGISMVNPGDGLNYNHIDIAICQKLLTVAPGVTTCA